jgi:hypothetical protein
MCALRHLHLPIHGALSRTSGEDSDVMWSVVRHDAAIESALAGAHCRHCTVYMWGAMPDPQIAAFPQGEVAKATSLRVVTY